MRVMLVSHGYPPVAGGGTEISVEGIAEALARTGDEVMVLAREGDPSRPHLGRRRERRGGVGVVRVNNTFAECRSLLDTYADPRMRPLLEEEVARFSPDVAHIHHLTGLSTDLVDVLASRGVPVAVTLNDYWMMCHRGQLLDRGLERCAGPEPAACARCLGTTMEAGAERIRHMREVLARATRLFAPSPTLRDRFLGFGVPPDLIVLVEQGIARERFRAAAARRRPSAVLRVGFAGTLMVSKAPHLLLEAMALLPPGRATATVLGGYAAYHGDDSYGAVVRPLLSTRDVSAPGPVPHDEIPGWMADMDVLVVPSVWIENAPFVIREAYAAGLPVVASDLGGMRDMVRHERTGLLFRAGDSADLARCLRRLIEDPGLLFRLRAGLPEVMTLAEEAAHLRLAYGEMGKAG